MGCINVSIVILFNKLALYQYKHAFFIPGKFPCSESYSVDINVATNDFLLMLLLSFYIILNLLEAVYNFPLSFVWCI